MAKFTKAEIAKLEAGQWITVVNLFNEERSILVLDKVTIPPISKMVSISYLCMGKRAVVCQTFHLDSIVGVNDILKAPAPCNQANRTDEDTKS